jgi:hypothetical protein
MNTSTTQAMRRLLGAAVLAAGVGFFGSVTDAQSGGPVVLLLDRNAIAPNQAPNAFSEPDVNFGIAQLGLRDVLPAFLRNLGRQIALPVGVSGHEGWFTLAAVPSAWASASTSGNPTADFVVAGAGLGSPDETGNRGSLLDSVPGVKPLSGSDLQGLVGRVVCAVVYQDEIPRTEGGTSLRGKNLGLVSFSIASVSQSGASVNVLILDAVQKC